MRFATRLSFAALPLVAFAQDASLVVVPVVINGTFDQTSNIHGCIANRINRIYD
jgi:hypothetical protein